MRETVKAAVLVIILAVVIALSGCATGTKLGKMVSSYELAGTSLRTAYNTVKPLCDAQQLEAARCAQAKKVYNDARAGYLLAGDALIVAVQTDDLVKRQAALQDYQTLAGEFTLWTSNLVKLLVEWGVVK